MTASPLRIAMWSGPRNISTALMRSFEARGDTAVSDEPLYAAYLFATGLNHPGREEILASQSVDGKAVLLDLAQRAPGPKVWYQKHMAHHLLPEFGTDGLSALRHAFLLREPRAMLSSLAKVLPEVRIEDTGLPQQKALFDRFRAEGQNPPVIDSKDVLADPRGLLQSLCEALGLPFMDEMLRWESGPRATDGIWAKHWYANVMTSTGFEAAPLSPPAKIEGALQKVLDEAEPLYAELHRFRLEAAPRPE